MPWSWYNACDMQYVMPPSLSLPCYRALPCPVSLITVCLGYCVILSVWGLDPAQTQHRPSTWAHGHMGTCFLSMARLPPTVLPQY